MGEFASEIVLKPEDRQPLHELVASHANLFMELWNGHSISLPTHSWAMHRIEKTTVGPLVVINEMMANGHGIPFPLKQLVISSSGNMMALVLNQVIDVSIISSVMPLQTIEDLQEALKYFDQIDCEYVYEV